MKIKTKTALVAGWIVTLSIPLLAQTPANSTPATQGQTATQTVDTVANEIMLLRKSLQTLNARLREVSEKVLASEGKAGEQSKQQQNRISLSLNLLGQAEQRAEILRKQLIELIEKEMSVRSLLVQIEEEIRPESIERASNLNGSTRTLEIREVRRRVLENERRGFDSLLRQVSDSRIRLEEDVKQADVLVTKIRQRIFPLIEKEIEKLIPN